MPRPIESLAGKNILNVSAGSQHFVAVVGMFVCICACVVYIFVCVLERGGEVYSVWWCAATH